MCLLAFQVFFFIFTISKSEDFKLTVMSSVTKTLCKFNDKFQSSEEMLSLLIIYCISVCIKKPHSVLFPHAWFQSQSEILREEQLQRLWVIMHLSKDRQKSVGQIREKTLQHFRT